MKYRSLLSLLIAIAPLSQKLVCSPQIGFYITVSDKRETHIQFAGAGLTAVGAYSLAQSQTITGTTLVAAGLIGLLYSKEITQLADNLYDRCMEAYYEEKTKDSSNPTDFYNCLWYKGKKQLKQLGIV